MKKRKKGWGRRKQGCKHQKGPGEKGISTGSKRERKQEKEDGKVNITELRTDESGMKIILEIIKNSLH